ncbi:MAG: hypothetical protein COV48_01510 [Elusimicrobia bacterium CG11_big_fil_rev_8_21_14_0_20_64_6]|nr:MAG: hypothetical protein COV48_01510 [Elusimicrobia bacterium CG11_big_fil_rev_8_21_14_0_20_64_6]
MNRHAKSAVACIAFMLATAIPCLIRTTPVTMSLFFFAGLPALALGMFFYLTSLFQFIKSHWV